MTLERDDERAASYELEWMSVHRTLCDLAKQRVALDATEGTHLLEAEDLHVFKRLGYRTMSDYMVGELGYTKHAANERLRVSRELLMLPTLAATYSEGELCFSKVRELTRVVTPETEAAFVVAAAGKDSHQVAKMVSGLKRGDQPDAVPDPALVTRRVGFELHPEALALLTAKRAALAAALGRAPTDDESSSSCAHPTRRAAPNRRSNPMMASSVPRGTAERCRARRPRCRLHSRSS